MKTGFLNCEDCNPRIMHEEGCCTTDVGKGTKLLVSNRGTRILACALLTKYDDGWGCRDYENRPSVCESFNCHRINDIK